MTQESLGVTWPPTWAPRRRLPLTAPDDGGLGLQTRRRSLVGGVTHGARPSDRSKVAEVVVIEEINGSGDT